MLYRLTFKKAFGHDFVPVEVSIWMVEFMVNRELKFSMAGKEFTFSTGSFGESEQDKFILGYGRSYEGDIKPISQVPTINISFNAHLAIDDSFHSNGIIINEMIYDIIEPSLRLAYEALGKVIDAHRIIKYNVNRMSATFRKGEIIMIEEMTMAEFQRYLY